MKTHTEDAFEKLIVEHLVLHGGYEPRGRTAFDPDEALAKHSDYDTKRALIPSDLYAFIEATQPKPWAKLHAIHGVGLEATFLDALCKDLDRRGALPVIRHGLKFYGQTIRPVVFAPGHGLNPRVQALYDANRLRVVRQLRYDPNNSNELDLAIFINGLPIATAELKNPLTRQGVAHAKRQYREDRDPEAPLLRFQRRALVHFALDADEAWMTTELRRGATVFLPFNRGDRHGKGNPAVAGKHRTFYLWEQVWQRDSLLDLVGRFIHLEKKTKTDPNSGRKTTTERMIFPRYHQMDCVRRLVDQSREHGAGSNYLVQHSAGSGKSNSIAWLAHRLASLHDAEDRKVYDSVVVLTDRRVLDQQLQDTIYQFEHKTGVVEKIDKDSAQLAAALTDCVPIIISTIHKFGFIQDMIVGALPDRRYAIIVDEAHSSQSGEMAVNVKELLSDSSLEKKLADEGEDLSTPDQLALRAALFRGPQANMSFFAFTATPKYKTLEMFGHQDADGRPTPFHLYSMRQAIEEGFILDVLQGYTTYERFFKLARAVADDPRLDKKKAAAALARFVNLHPTNIAQKTEIIVEHFRGCVMHQIEGRAKAMVVTGSRLLAVKYKLAFDTYVKDKGYHDLHCLVAFSGEVRDDRLPGVTYTEAHMNAGIRETELPDKFASNAYQVLIVANKYQTGFDQPLLCAMYVDKRLAGIQAVQTLSRLNRMYPGKEQTLVLDFVNKRKDILAGFQDYYETTTVEDQVDPQRLYELQNDLDDFRVYTMSEVDGFGAVFFQPEHDKKPADNKRLNAWLDPAVDRFKALDGNGGEPEGSEHQEEFRGKLNAFKQLYGFLGQIVPFSDPDLEKLYAYGRMLVRKLPRTESGGPLDLGDDVVLSSFRLRKMAQGDLAPNKDQAGELPAPDYVGSGSGKAPTEKLSTIIDMINQRFGTKLENDGFVEDVATKLENDDDLRQAARVNDKGNFAVPFREALDNALLDRHGKNEAFINLLFENEDLRGFFRAVVLDRVYEQLTEPGTRAG